MLSFFFFFFFFLKKMLLCCLLFVIGLVGIAFSVYVSFVFALLMIVLVGAASSFGESILLTYQRKFPAEVVGGWSSGTGLAGTFIDDQLVTF
jgi:hypothetical protein